MKKVLAVLAGIMIHVSAGCSEVKEAPSLSAIEQGFKNTPDSIRIGCYWYWLSDNISKEGIVKDLHAMKKAGITRAFIGNIGKEIQLYGDVKIFTPEWWDAVHTALKTATELDIEIGMFNCPGWSQSGGPWIKPEQSMRYLAATDRQVKGPRSLSYTVPGYSDTMQLVRVIAYPVADTYKKEWKVQQKGYHPVTIDMRMDSKRTIHSFQFSTNDHIRTNAELQVRTENGYKTIRKFEIDRSNYQPIVGFHPNAPVVLSLPATEATDFRLLLDTPTLIHGGMNATVTLSSERVVERYPEQSLAKMYQRPDPQWDSYMWPDRDWYRDSAGFTIPQDKVTDLTALLSADGALTWDVPEGDWVISCLEMKTTGVTNAPAAPDATGLEVDKLSKKHIAAHFDAYMGEILRRIPKADRKSLKVAVQDSYETGGQNWTDDILERFKEVYGYDPLPYLPALQGKVVGNEDLSSRFLWDLRRLVADGVSYEYVGGLREICHQHGLTTWLENYGHWGFPGEFLQYGGQSDEIGGEFWSVGELGLIENRAASSCGHIYGKKRIWSESCTSGGPNYTRYPEEMKARIDRFFTEGINATSLHVNIHQPYENLNPGMSAWFGNDFNRKNTWFSQIDLFTGYLRRANHMLQQGTYTADVAYFIGEDTPKMTGMEDPRLPKGYSFDYMNAEVLLTRATVKDGCLTLPDGMKYRLLVLPGQKSMRPEVLKKVAELVREGLAVYGDAPTYSPSLAGYPEADKEVRRLGKELFAAGMYGAGKVFRRGTDIQEALNILGVHPDFRTGTDVPVLFIHRTLADGEIYFLSNQSEEKVSFDGAFRVAEGLSPELWDPVTADIRHLPDVERSGENTVLHIELEGSESAFIVFRKGVKAKEKKKNYTIPKTVCRVNTPWSVAFEAGKRGPDKPV
ncbi:MAG: glycoside hydrolase family 2, partial [Mediterranea sp.]|nr:glycoside hydrolase family 2 [Mediterranea sp.]